MKSALRLIAVSAALFAAAPPVSARDILVGVEDVEYYPVYAVRGGDYVGFMREVMDAYARSAGHSVTYRPLPVKRLYAELAAGGIDLTLPDTPEWSVEAKTGLNLKYSAAIVDFVDGVMVRPGSTGKTVDELRVIGTVSGYTPTAWSDRIASKKIEITETPRMDTLLRQAAVGHVDGAYVNVVAAEQALNGPMRMPGALVFNPALPHARGSYRLSAAKADDVIAEFDDWMSKNPALLSRLKRRFGLDGAP